MDKGRFRLEAEVMGKEKLMLRWRSTYTERILCGGDTVSITGRMAALKAQPHRSEEWFIRVPFQDHC